MKVSAITSTPPQVADTPSRRGRVLRLVRGPDTDPRWARPALLGLLALTAVLYLWNLAGNGWANDFYAAAVQAGTKSWKAFFFGSFDSSNFITVDKTPASLWVMDISGRIFGFSQWSMLAPQAVAGIGSVALLYAAVRRWFGPAAGLIAGLVLALTPTAALMFRFDNPDALLVLLMTAAAYALVRAVESGRARWLVLCGVLLGFAFLTKMTQAFLVVPGFAVAYLWAGPPRLARRLLHLLAAGLGIVAGAGWWLLAAQLTPAADRPYFGSSTNNNILQLTLGYNGVDRLTGSSTNTGVISTGGGPGNPFGSAAVMKAFLAEFGGSPGVSRLFSSDFGGQITWVVPAALIALAAMAWVSRRAARTDRTRAAALIWGGWVLVTGGVFSYMNGIIHPYYMIALAPGLGALVGIGATMLWQARPAAIGRGVAAASVAATTLWAWVLLDRTPGWLPWLRWIVLLAGAADAVALVAWPHVARLARSRRRRLAVTSALACSALVAGLAGPAAYTLATVSSSHTGLLPVAGPQPDAVPESATGGSGGSIGMSGALIGLIEQDAPKYRWSAAAMASFEAAPLELATGDAVMALGGFRGADPWPTLTVFKGLVARHDVHYYVSQYTDPPGAPGPALIAHWVKTHFKGRTIGGFTIYDLTQQPDVAPRGQSMPR
jgi:4-amino-4-deoxy-L-arabinose transferase-like glycosyltransferase